MNRYVVTVFNPNNVYNERTAYNSNRQAVAVYNVEQIQKENFWDNDHHGMKAYYTETYSFAEALAKVLAENNPLCDVYVSKIEAIVVLPKVDCKVSKVTEKGVVPE